MTLQANVHRKLLVYTIGVRDPTSFEARFRRWNTGTPENRPLYSPGKKNNSIPPLLTFYRSGLLFTREFNLDDLRCYMCSISENIGSSWSDRVHRRCSKGVPSVQGIESMFSKLWRRRGNDKGRNQRANHGFERTLIMSTTILLRDCQRLRKAADLDGWEYAFRALMRAWRTNDWRRR